ncbi:unnamed protein product, partial [Discosporangium mesarthrocarpum]
GSWGGGGCKGLEAEEEEEEEEQSNIQAASRSVEGKTAAQVVAFYYQYLAVADPLIPCGGVGVMMNQPKKSVQPTSPAPTANPVSRPAKRDRLATTSASSSSPWQSPSHNTQAIPAPAPAHTHTHASSVSSLPHASPPRKKMAAADGAGARTGKGGLRVDKPEPAPIGGPLGEGKQLSQGRGPGEGVRSGAGAQAGTQME